MLRASSYSLAVFAAASLAGSSLAAQGAQYHVVKRMDLGRTRADYIIVDPAGRRLYGLGDNVIDVDRDSVVGHVEGGGGGYAIAPDLHRGLVRNGVVFDLRTLAVTGHVDARGDGIRYEPVTHRAFTWRDKDAWVVDMRTGKLITKSTIGDGLESGVADGRGKLFLNVEDSGFVQRVDAKSLAIEKTYKIPGCGRAQGLSMDTRTRRLFMACDTEMVVVNADNGDIAARIHVPSRADQNCFDPTRKLAFNPNRVDSTMTVVHEDSPSRFSVVETVPTGGGARTCAVDDRTHRVYVFYYEGTTRENAQLVLAVLAPGAASTQRPTSPEAQLQQEAKITKDSARAVATRTVPNGRIESTELEREHGKLIYSFDMRVAGKSGIEEVNVDAMTGALVAHEHESPRAEKAEARKEAKEKTKKP